MMRETAWIVLVVLAAQSPALGGTFIMTDRCPNDPFITVHPTGYDGAGGDITIGICLVPDTPAFVLPALQQAVDTWNGFASVSPNCQSCLTIEEAIATDDPYNLVSTLMHELGHCAFGIGHPNHLATSFTASRRDCPTPPDPLPPVAFDEGADKIIGSSDDFVSPFPGTRILHWFRIADNNPAAIDMTVIDQDTFSRRLIDLPGDDRWPANLNRIVANDLLGSSDTQSVVYSDLARGSSYTGLSADDVATVEYGYSGLDSDANTLDDYRVTLAIEPDCVNADIEGVFERRPTVSARLFWPLPLKRASPEMFPSLAQVRSQDWVSGSWCQVRGAGCRLRGNLRRSAS